MWIGLAIVAALQFYYVQEMIAAFVVLGVLFALVAGVGLLLFLVDRASERTQSWVELCALAVLRTARRGVNFAGTFTTRRAAAPNATPSSIERGSAIHV
jgi:hypothetical protein